MKPTQLQMKQLIAAGGLAGDLCEHIQELEKKVDYQAKTIDIANKCMKEKQKRIDKQSEFIYNIRATNAFDDYGSKLHNMQRHIKNWEKNNPKNLITWMK